MLILWSKYPDVRIVRTSVTSTVMGAIEFQDAGEYYDYYRNTAYVYSDEDSYGAVVGASRYEIPPCSLTMFII